MRLGYLYVIKPDRTALAYELTPEALDLPISQAGLYWSSLSELTTAQSNQLLDAGIPEDAYNKFTRAVSAYGCSPSTDP